MSYHQIIGELRKKIESSISSLGVELLGFALDEPPSPELGDIATNAAFLVSKKINSDPYRVAVDLASILERQRPNYISSILPHSSGYINFNIDYAELVKSIFKTKDGFRLPPPEKILRVSVEHTSVNPNKALHIGHARNVVIGDTIAKLFQEAGHDVAVLNYIDDTGVQVADIVLGVTELGMQLEPEDGRKFDHFIGDTVYVRVNREYERDKSLIDKRKEISRQIEHGEGRIAEIARTITRKVLNAQLETCWKLGAEYDLLNFESDILRAGYWQHVFSQLKEKGVVKLQQGGKYDGCWVMEGDENEEEKVLVRSDGTAVYAAKDIPYAAWKLGIIPDRFNYEVFCIQPSGKVLWSTSINSKKKSAQEPDKEYSNRDVTIAVIDIGQSRLQKFVKKALTALSLKGEGYVHLAYEKVFLSRETAMQLFQGEVGGEESGIISMKGRSGVYINVDDLLEELKKKAVMETRKRNPDSNDSFVQEVAEAIAISALRYELLKQDLNKAIIFDINESLKLEGDTGPYLMYSYARACSILSKAWSVNIPGVTIPASLTKEEKSLILHLSKIGFEFSESLKYLTPKPMVRYAHDLAVIFNNFYEACPVLSAPKETAEFRIALVDTYKKVMGKALDLIGIKHPEAI
ncbi:MAG: arginine--tRNA ligase [Conexivisphaerales archaeon]